MEEYVPSAVQRQMSLSSPSPKVLVVRMSHNLRYSIMAGTVIPPVIWRIHDRFSMAAATDVSLMSLRLTNSSRAGAMSFTALP